MEVVSLESIFFQIYMNPKKHFESLISGVWLLTSYKNSGKIWKTRFCTFSYNTEFHNGGVLFESIFADIHKIINYLKPKF